MLHLWVEFALFEVWLVSFMILCLASIGLISQIYHTGGELYQALLLWSVMTSGAAAASKRYFVPFIWATGFLSGITLTALESPAFQPIFQNHEHAILMTVPLLCALLAMMCRSIAGQPCSQTKVLRVWTIFVAMIVMPGGAMTIILNSYAQYEFIDDIMVFVPGYVLAVLLALGIWMSREYKKAQKLLLLLTLGIFLVPFHFPMLEISSKVAYSFFYIAALATIAVFLASLKLRSFFHLVLVVLGIRFVSVYFEALGGLATTGFGLIFSGILIIAMVFVWYKYRREIIRWTEGIIQ